MPECYEPRVFGVLNIKMFTADKLDPGAPYTRTKSLVQLSILLGPEVHVQVHHNQIV